MDSNFHFTIDLNEDQNHQPFFSSLGSSLHHNHDHQHLHQAPFNPSFPSSSLTPPSLSYHPFLINSHQDQVHVGYNNNTFHGFLDPHLSQPFETKKFVSNGESSSNDQMVPKKQPQLKLTIRKKDNQDQDQINPRQSETNSLKWISSKVRLMKKKTTMITTTDNNKQHASNEQSLSLRNLEEDHHDHLKKISSTNQYNISVNENGYNGSNNCVIRICSDCNTTKTPLWRSGPRGPKSLCNACGIRQRKARRAAAAAAATVSSDVSPPLLKKKTQNKNKRSNGDYDISSPSAPKVKKCKRMATSEEEAVPMMEVVATTGDLETQTKSTMSLSSTSSSTDKYYSDDLAIILSKSSAYQQFFPQDEKEAAILLMALSYGMVHG